MVEDARLGGPTPAVPTRSVRRWSGPLAQAALSVALPLAVVTVLALLLQLAKDSGFLPVTIPSPAEIAGAFAEKWPDLLYHTGPTVAAAATGYAVAATMALTLGAASATWPRSEGAIFRVGIIVDSIPLIALTPILMIWLGTGMASRIVIATIAALFPLVVGAIQGFKAVDRNAAELFHVLSAGPWQQLVKLSLPVALPYFFAALKVAAPLAVLGALIAEWVNADRGLGIMMIYALFSFDVPLVWLTIISVCLVSVSAYGAVALAERLVVRFDTGGRGESRGA